MNWSKSIGVWEIFLIFSFLGIYIFYFFKVYNIGKTLGKPSKIIFLKFILRILYLSLLIIALLGPSFGVSKTETHSFGKDYLLMMDLSASMDCSDVIPSRLEKAKLELINLIENSKGDRFGIVVFSTKAYWQIPLTHDKSLVKEYIEKLSTSMMPNKGSNLAAPLELLTDESLNDMLYARSKIALIFTDGETFGPIEQKLKDKITLSKNQIVLVAVGTETGSNVLVENKPQVLENGELAISKLDLKQLKSLASQIKSSLVHLNGQKNNLQEIINSSGNMVLKENEILMANNKYESFLLIALILIFMDVMISAKVFQV
jgi:Ca-activated chloride channel family protein